MKSGILQVASHRSGKNNWLQHQMNWPVAESYLLDLSYEVRYTPAYSIEFSEPVGSS